ncbi:hypothetical protein EDB85DRAFT_2158375 [Lactarius pseudohatsudake]|nr:hypothetical protein EDB85DRAFT_2158375 [Lactarius pseudohatsudake]
MAKLSAENAGNLELTSHRRAVTVTSVGLASTPQPSPPVPEPFASTTPTDFDEESSFPGPGPVPTQTSTKRPGQLSSHSTLDMVDDAGVAVDVPKAKKLKKTPRQLTTGLQADVSIIEIDDVDNLQNERLNRTDPTADIKAFFTAVPCVPGQNKERMWCNLCTQGLGCPKQDKVLISKHSTLHHHAAALHMMRYQKWCNANKFDSMLPLDSKQCKPIPFSSKALENTALEWLIQTNQPILAFNNAAFKKMLNIAS